MNTNEVLKLALEALEPLVKRASPYGEVDWLTGCKAITALREALAEQPTQQGHSCYCPNCEALSKELAELQAQKPIAWRVKWPAIGGGYKWMMVDSPLMEKEGFVNEALYTSPSNLPGYQAMAMAVTRLQKRCSDLEGKQPAQQEPVVRWDSDGWGDLLVDGLPDGTLLYTSPPAQRTWVGLTQEEFRDFASTFEYGTGGLIRAIEAKLKEKNT